MTSYQHLLTCSAVTYFGKKSITACSAARSGTEQWHCKIHWPLKDPTNNGLDVFSIIFQPFSISFALEQTKLMTSFAGKVYSVIRT